MKTLSFEQMQAENGGGVAGCASQILGEMGLLGSAVQLLAYGSCPIGWALLGVSAAALALAIADDPSVCDRLVG